MPLGERVGVGTVRRRNPAVAGASVECALSLLATLADAEDFDAQRFLGVAEGEGGPRSRYATPFRASTGTSTA